MNENDKSSLTQNKRSIDALLENVDAEKLVKIKEESGTVSAAAQSAVSLEMNEFFYEQRNYINHYIQLADGKAGILFTVLTGLLVYIFSQKSWKPTFEVFSTPNLFFYSWLFLVGGLSFSYLVYALSRMHKTIPSTARK